MRKKEKKKMVIFTTVFASKMGEIKDLLVILGKEKEAKEIDKEYQRRKFFGPWGLGELANLYQGFSEYELREAALDYCQKNLLKGLREFSSGLKEKGFLVGALSSDPQFMMDVVKEILSLDFIAGTELEFKEGVATGRIQKEVNRYTKAEIIKIKTEEHALAKENVITIGRSCVAHLPMARESGMFIGLDPAKDTISDIARSIVVNRGLRKIFFGKI